MSDRELWYYVFRDVLCAGHGPEYAFKHADRAVKEAPATPPEAPPDEE